MEDLNLEYFSLGFRTSNSIEQLNKIKDKNEYNPFLIKDAYDIIHPLALIAKKRFDEVKVGTFGTLLRLIYGGKGKVIINPKEIEKIKKRLCNIVVTEMVLEDIMKGREISNANIDIAVKTFVYLDDKCLEYCQPRIPCF